MPLRRFPTLLLFSVLMIGARAIAEPTVTFVEWAPLEIGNTHEVWRDSAFDRNGNATLPSYRVESFGNTRLRIAVSATAPATGVRPYVRIEGPLAGYGDAVAVGRGTTLVAGENSVAATLTAPGIYRVIPGTYETIVNGTAPGPDVRLRLSAQCVANCFRAEITPEQLLAGLSEARQQKLLEYVESELRRHLNVPELQAAIMGEWRRLVRDRAFASLGRFPVIPPLTALGTLRPLLGNLSSQRPAPQAVIRGELATLLAAGRVNREEQPGPAHPQLPEVGYGHFNNKALPKNQAAQSPVLAQILTALAANNGSEITYGTYRIRTPEELFRALIATGHKVQLRNERTFANFLSFTFEGKNLKWPVWLDTGLLLTDGSTYVVPSGHSQHTWRIHGPVANGRVMFFLGIFGVGFFPQIDERPAWTGMTVHETAYSGTEETDMWIIRAVEYAAKYLRRIRGERDTVAKGMPADGYGYLGICNDSNAVLELATRSTITTYPLIRARELRNRSRQDDGLDALFARLPTDADVLPLMLLSPAYHRDALCRALQMTPYPDDSPHFPDARLREQTQLARRMLGNACRPRQGR